MSSLRISVGGFEDGGSRYRWSTTKLSLLELCCDSFSEGSLPLCSDFGGVGGNMRETDDISLTFFMPLCSMGEADSEMISVDMV